MNRRLHREIIPDSGISDGSHVRIQAGSGGSNDLALTFLNRIDNILYNNLIRIFQKPEQRSAVRMAAIF